MASPSSKIVLMAVLVICFGIQTFLVYTDDRSEPLTEQAVAGRALYHRDACQVCHQLYGQGGFLGPDLTNTVSRVDEARLKSLLTVGSGQMPALHYTEAEVERMAAFLAAMDRPERGRGQLRLGKPGEAEAAILARAIHDATAAGSPVDRGFAALSGRSCNVCHLLFRASPVGGPDLSIAAGQLTSDQLRSVLTDGRPASGMPSPVPAFSNDELDDVIAYLSWLHAERDALRKQAEFQAPRSIDWASIPSWEFQ